MIIIIATVTIVIISIFQVDIFQEPFRITYWCKPFPAKPTQHNKFV